MAIKNVKWMFELDGKTNFECMLSWPEGTKQEFIDNIREAAKKVFSKVHEFTYPDATETTWPAGANWSWQRAAEWIRLSTDYKGNGFPFPKVFPDNTPWLFLEADAVPLKRGWMQTLADEYKRGGKPFMGHIVKDMGHMNGVGVYPNFVAQYAPNAFHVVHSAWDVALKATTSDLTHNANHLIQHCWVLINGQVSHNGDGIMATFRDTGEMHRLIEKDAVLFHRTKDGSLIDCLMQTHRDPIQPYTGEVSAKQVILKGAGPFPEKTGYTVVANPDDLDVPARIAKSIKETTPDDPPYNPVKVVENPGTAELYASSVTSYDVRQFPNGFPHVEIFIVTYHKDAEWLKYCLHSIKQFCKGFTGVTVVVPDRDVDVLEPICREWGPDVVMDTFTEVEGKGMIHHQGIKMMADEFCQHAKYILHTDSDCIFTEPVTPGDYFVEGKPVLLVEAYERFIDRYPTILQWKVTTEKALKFEATMEGMRRHPAVHHRALYPAVRKRIEEVHKKSFKEYVLSCKPDFPQGISEFNVLAAYAWKHMHDQYHWIDVGTELRPKDKIHQNWSHGGLDRPTDTGAYVPMTPRQIFQKVLGI